MRISHTYEKRYSWDPIFYLNKLIIKVIFESTTNDFIIKLICDGITAEKSEPSQDEAHESPPYSGSISEKGLQNHHTNAIDKALVQQICEN